MVAFSFIFYSYLYNPIDYILQLFYGLPIQSDTHQLLINYLLGNNHYQPIYKLINNYLIW